MVAAAVATLPARSCLIDGEAIVSDDSGFAKLLCSFRHDHAAVLCAFDLLEVDGEDLQARKRTLAKLLRRPHPGIALNEHYVGHGDIVYRLQARLRRDRVEAARLGVPLRPLEAMGQGQVFGGASGAARGGRGLGPKATLDEPTRTYCKFE